MSHYYENDPNLDKTEFPISFTLQGKTFTLSSSAGVFSKEGLDTGTRILLNYLLEHAKPALDVLDLGCGIGVVGVVLGTFWHCEVVGIDPNEQACHLAKKNYAAYHIQGDVLEQDHLDSGLYSCIVINPPIRTGKQVIYSLFEQCAKQLRPGGTLWVVIRKQHGGQSALDYLNSLGLKAMRVFRNKGFWILEAKKEEEIQG
ncbi:MAG: methyltransferase [Allobaculum sp.]|nr:methyltransferase [Allobaculum sp.]MDE5757400.1 methyltransferase [Allobaculum sp.]